MIVLHVTHKDPNRVVEIAEQLIKEKLITDVNIEFSKQRHQLTDGQISTTEVTEMQAKTKALLFTTVYDRIQSMHPEDRPEVYSLPIVNMDWDQTQQILQRLVQV